MSTDRPRAYLPRQRRVVEWTPDRGRRVLAHAKAEAERAELMLNAARSAIETQRRLLAEAGEPDRCEGCGEALWPEEADAGAPHVCPPGFQPDEGDLLPGEREALTAVLQGIDERLQ